MDQNVLGALVADAQERGVPAQNLMQELKGEEQLAANFNDPEVYLDYREKLTELGQAMEQQYGEKAPEAVSQIFEDIRERHGEEVYNKVCQDPSMLEPGVLFGLAGGEAENPYLKYLSPTNNIPAAQGQNVPPNQGSHLPGGQTVNVEEYYKPGNEHLLTNPATMQQLVMAQIQQKNAQLQQGFF